MFVCVCVHTRTHMYKFLGIGNMQVLLASPVSVCNQICKFFPYICGSLYCVIISSVPCTIVNFKCFCDIMRSVYVNAVILTKLVYYRLFPWRPAKKGHQSVVNCFQKSSVCLVNQPITNCHIRNAEQQVIHPTPATINTAPSTDKTIQRVFQYIRLCFSFYYDLLISVLFLQDKTNVFRQYVFM